MSNLTIPTEGPCKGHPCDNCKTCQGGRCCRRDNPNYRLPELGEWDGPIYGELGVLNDDGDKVECHVCGGWFHRLGEHAQRSHDLTPAEYRSVFGLAYRAALVGPTFREHLRQRDHSMLEHGGLNITPEQRSAILSRPRRLQVRRELAERISGEGHDRIRPQGRKQKTVALSQYVGVTASRKKWRAQLVFNYQHHELGIHDTEEAAARAYDAKARELYGDKARLNFPDEAQP